MKTKLLSFNGRSTRSAYWAISLTALIVLLAAVMAVDAALSGESPPPAIIMIIFIPFFWISLAVQVRRCHDLERSGWMILVGLIPIVGQITMLVVLGFFPGTRGENRYGIEPDWF